MTFGLAVVTATVALSSSAHSTAITVSNVALYYADVSPNDVGVTSGETIQYSANATPNGGGTTGTATTTNLSTQAPITRSIPFNPGSGTPDFFSGALALCTSDCAPSGNNNLANLTGPWTLTFQNASTTPTSASSTLSLAGPGEIPFVNSITLSGTSTTPIFSWSAPAGLSPSGYRVQIYQNNLVKPGNDQAGVVLSTNLLPSVTSYTFPGYQFSTNTT